MVSQGAQQHQLDALAREAIANYDFPSDATVELINVSENSTYRVTDPSSGRRAALRVHRLGYHTSDEIESELLWVKALGHDGVVDVPAVIPAVNGTQVLAVSTAELRDPRDVVLFDWVAGDPPSDDVASFLRLGALTARMHQHAKSWIPSRQLARFVWDHDTTIGSSARWGRWQDGLGIGREERTLFERLDLTLRRRLESYGKSDDRFGLVHADLRLANLLVEGDRTTVIDFDDCGTSWFMYDWGTAVSFIEHEPSVPELQAAWAEGYRSVAPLASQDEAELPTFMMLRRLLLIAWVGSHSAFSPEAAELGAGFTAGSCELAERFLSQTA